MKAAIIILTLLLVACQSSTVEESPQINDDVDYPTTDVVNEEPAQDSTELVDIEGAQKALNEW